MVQLTDIQKVHAGPVQVLDAKGNPAALDGAPSWSSSDPTIVSVTPSADGLEADIVAVGPLTPAGSSVQVVVSADADLGAGVTTITGSLDVTVVASQAVSITIPTGTPVNA